MHLQLPLQRAAAHLLIAGCLVAAPPALQLRASATSPAEVMACVARDCRAELAACVSSPMCAQGLACTGSKVTDPVGQVRCMDLYENEAMRRFADCAMTQR